MPIKRLDHVNFITHDMTATIKFYCDIIGLTQGSHLSIDTAQSVYFYIEGQNFPILHIGNAKLEKKQPKYERFAELSENSSWNFSTGSFDHFCLLLDDHDYDGMIKQLNKHNIQHQTYCHQDIALKQIWVLDPNGVRVELNFVP